MKPIIGSRYDAMFFLTAPLWCALVVWWLHASGVGALPLEIGTFSLPFAVALQLTFTKSHLWVTFWRSHGRKEIFSAYPKRLVLVPLGVFLTGVASEFALALILILTIWWDAYHSSLQTFGFGRLYDRNAGNSVEYGRRWDIGLNLLMYMGPILAGSAFAEHLKESLDAFPTFSGWVELWLEHRNFIAIVLATLGVGFVAAYLRYFGKAMARGEYRFPKEKLILYASTFPVSLYAWGWNPAGQAFVIMNLFHAVQYFALIAYTERENVARKMGVSAVMAASIVIVSAFLLACSVDLGWMLAERGSLVHRTLWSLSLTVALFHFWSDGFIWSVRRGRFF